MKLRALVLAAITALAASGAHAQSISAGFNPRTGDVWVDARLADINHYGARYRDPFVDELVRYHDAPRELVIDLLVNRRWSPGDVYFACALAHIVGRPCRFVVEQYERDRGLGWGELAKRLGIKPGSPEFHRLKRGFVPTYDRWGRAIELDADLERDFPGRSKGKQARGGHGDAKGPSHAGKAHGNGHGRGKGHGGDKGQGGDRGKGKGGGT